MSTPPARAAFIANYRSRTPDGALENFEWYSALHSLRILIQVAEIQRERTDSPSHHPFGALLPIAVTTLTKATGAPIAAGA
jgi:hypothetical protein